MTSSVRTSAHCASDKEVVVRVYNHVTGETIEEFTLQDGQARDVVIYDDRAVASRERLKEVPAV
jgi:hypothetical protein